jgi:hypothetical protein
MIAIASGRGLQGRLVYRRSEHSFDFEPAHPVSSSTTTSLQYGTLQMEVMLPSGIAQYVWGYHPQESWDQGVVVVPVAPRGLIEVRDSDLMREGVSTAKIKVGEWHTINDLGSGWLRFGGSTDGGASYCEFGDAMVAAVAQGALTAFYLCPHYL